MVHYITVNTRPRVYVLRFRVWVVKSCVQESALHKSTSLQVAILEGHGEAWCFCCFGIWDFVRVGLGFRVSVLGFRFLGFRRGLTVSGWGGLRLFGVGVSGLDLWRRGLGLMIGGRILRALAPNP